MSKVRILYWFRTDLRLHDSPALKAALDLNPSSFFPVWCWDPQYVYKHRVGVNRFRFLLESMQNLSESITKINPLSQLLVIRGEPSALLPQLWKRLEITHLCFEADVNGYARNRDNQIKELAKKAGIEIIERDGHQLYDIKKVVEMNNGKPIMNMNTYRKVIEPLKAPAKPLPTPTSLPSPLISSNKPKDREAILSDLASKLEGLPNYTTSKDQVDLNSSTLGGQRLQEATCYSDATADFSFSVPTLESLGMDPENSGAPKQASVPGGESEALKRLSEICKDAHYVATFAKPKTAPTQDTSDPATTLLSPYLKFGCLSVRKMWWDSEEVIKSYKGKDKKSEIPESLHGQLLFRDMYSAAELAVGDNFGRIRGNQISRFMDWYLPTHYDKDGNEIIPRPRGDEVSEARFEAFKAGQTGFPWIDALMRQLRSTGWIHHLGRHSLAAFLTRGQCWISWERGAEVFDTYLLDWDPASNPGNWMWLSCSAFFSQFFRVYGVATFPSKYDKTGALVRKWCPELAKYPDKFIYTPHLAPSSVQKEAGCIIGKDYPQPMLDEKESKAENLTRMKAAYAAKFYGTSKEVLEGKAEGILRKNHGVPDPKPFDLKKAKNDKIPDWAKVGNEKRTGAELKKNEGDEDEEVEMEGHEADVGDEHEEEEETGEKRKKKEESGEEDEEEEEEEKPKGKGKGKGKATAKKQKKGK